MENNCQNFIGADLSKAYFCEQDLRGVVFAKANLEQACFAFTKLTDVDFRGANLTGVSFYKGDIIRANFEGANLIRTCFTVNIDLSLSNFKDTFLDPNRPVPYVSNGSIKEAGLEIRGNKVYGWRTKKSRFYGSQEYEVGKEYAAPVFSVSPDSCHPGLYLAGKEWLNKHYDKVPLVRCYCLRNELHRAGDKWRAKRLWIVE